MGIALWLLCGAAVFVVTRAIRYARPRGFVTELLLAILVSFVAGLGATALDFGGWTEVDARAAAFVVFATFAVLGILRLTRPVLSA